MESLVIEHIQRWHARFKHLNLERKYVLVPGHLPQPIFVTLDEDYVYRVIRVRSFFGEWCIVRLIPITLRDLCV